MSDSPENVTRLLRAVAADDRQARDALAVAIYEDLRRIAAAHMRSERPDHTLQPTSIANEAFMRLVEQRDADWRDRAHFFAVASLVVRRLLVDHARERRALKRGGDLVRAPLEEAESVGVETDVDVEALDEALRELATLDERQARIVELRFFGGLSIVEVAHVLDLGARTVDREWRCARAWLFERLQPDAGGEDRG